jgi:aspartate aminotransferase-like enzyme
VCEARQGLIVDAMSSFAALPIDARKVRFDALVAASGKCLEGVPGMGFVFIRKAVLDGCAGHSQSLAMDLHDQHQYMEKTGQWRFTPPTHVVVALAEAIAQFEEEGGQPARLARYTANCRTLVDGMARLGFKPFLDPAIQAPIIVTFHAPGDARYDFKRSTTRQGARLPPLPRQAHPGGDLPRRLHRCHRPERDGAGRACGGPRWPTWASLRARQRSERACRPHTSSTKEQTDGR